MKTPSVIAIAIAMMTMTMAMTAPADGRAERRITGRSRQTIHDCRRDATVVVGGRSSRITLVGRCQLVQVTGDRNEVIIRAGLFLLVTGDENQVRVAATDAIRVSGGDNEITYGRSVTRSAKTLVTSSGPRNVIRRQAP